MRINIASIIFSPSRLSRSRDEKITFLIVKQQALWNNILIPKKFCMYSFRILPTMSTLNFYSHPIFSYSNIRKDVIKNFSVPLPLFMLSSLFFFTFTSYLTTQSNEQRNRITEFVDIACETSTFTIPSVKTSHC